MTKAAKANLSAEDRQFNKNKWLFGVSGIGRDMSYQLISSFLLTYIQFGMTLSIAQFTVISLIIGVFGRIWDAINDPMMGAIIEGSHMKFGKFRPWILIGAVLTGLILIIMFNVQTLVGWKFVVFMAVMYLLWESTFTMNDIGYWSMLASLSSKKEQRNQATMLTVVFAGVGAFIAQGGISFLYPGNVLQAFGWISIAVAVIFVLMQTVMVVFIKETPRSAMEQTEKVSMKQMWNTIKNNDQILWMTLVMLFYNVGSSLLVGLAYNLYYLEIGYDGMAIAFVAIFGIFNIGSQLVYPKLSEKFGRKKLQKISIVLACIGYAGIALLGWTSILPFNLITLSLFGIFVFVGQSWYYMACIINMTNCVEYNEYKRGERNEAVVSTLRPLMAKFADAVKYGIVTIILVVSTVYGLSQNVSTMEGQKGHFDRIEATQSATEENVRADYLQQLSQAFDLLETLPSEESAGYQQALEDLTAKLDSDQFPALKGKQLNAEYLHTLQDTYIVCKSGKQVVHYFHLGSITNENIDDVRNFDTTSNAQNSCTMLISNTDSANGIPVFNAANDNFRDKGDIGMRLWLRAAVTVIPVICLIVSLIIQDKKFIIDEKYYDMMMEEIDRRKESEQQTAEQAQ